MLTTPPNKRKQSNTVSPQRPFNLRRAALCQCACARRCMRGGGDAGDGVSQSQAFHKHPSIIPYLNTFEPKKMSSSQSSSILPRTPKPADRPDGVWVSQQKCRPGPTYCGPERGKGQGRLCSKDLNGRYCSNEWVLLRKDGSTLRGPLLAFRF